MQVNEDNRSTDKRLRNVRFIFVLTQHLNHATENMSDNAECYKAQSNA